MLKKVFVLAALALVGLMAPAWAGSDGEKHLLYLASPDGAQPGGSGTGILVFDIHDGHRFVRRITIPSLAGGVRGICASAATGKLYYSTSQKTLGCMDLRTDKILWEKTYETGCDRMAITPDGATLYVPSGWWNKDNCWLVIDGATGRLVTKIPVQGGAHNTLCSLDGSRCYLAGSDRLTVVETKDHQVMQTVKPVGGGFYPFTINGAHTRAYVCLFRQIGFQLCDLTSGQVIRQVLIDGPPQARRTHGIGLTPDEKELWLSDQAANRLYVFDATVMPPRQIAKVEISMGGHGWIGFSLDGCFAYPSSPDVIDVKTRKIVAVLKDEKGKPTCSSKFVEIDFSGGDVVRVGDQFGVGRVHGSEAPSGRTK